MSHQIKFGPSLVLWQHWILKDPTEWYLKLLCTIFPYTFVSSNIDKNLSHTFADE